MKQATVAVVGAGCVGTTIAYTLLMHTIARIILVDCNADTCAGEVADLSDVGDDSTPRISVGTLGQAGQADIIIITAGAPQKPGQERESLWTGNAQVVRSVIEGMRPIRSDALIIMVTNPVDLLSLLAQEISGLSAGQVYGSGTLLDTYRLKSLLSAQAGVARSAVDIAIIGEHGPHQLTTWSSGLIAGKPISAYPQIAAMQQQYDMQVRERVQHIIARKGLTQYGVAFCVLQYCQAIMGNAGAVLPVSCYIPEYQVYLSMPALLGCAGVQRIIPPLLDDTEYQQLREIVALLRAQAQQVQLLPKA